MNFAPLTTAALAAVLTLAGPASAADEHHPEASGPAAQAPAPPPSEARGGAMMGPRGTMGMMGPEGMSGMMRMMQMMGMMGERGPGAMSADREMTGMRMRAMTEHVEGRIAFLRAELKIVDSQAAAWNRFAEALRANAKRLGDVRPAMARRGGGEATLTQLLEQEERWLAARLEGAREIRTALTDLFPILTDEQRKLAERLVPPHIGLARMGDM